MHKYNILLYTFTEKIDFKLKQVLGIRNHKMLVKEIVSQIGKFVKIDNNWIFNISFEILEIYIIIFIELALSHSSKNVLFIIIAIQTLNVFFL